MPYARFHIPKMDCPSEENLIKLKLQGFEGQIEHLEFDLAARKLSVWYQGSSQSLQTLVADLKLGAEVESEEWVDYQGEQNSDQKEMKLLLYVLLINFSFFLLEGIAGWFGNSFGLQADGLDMLADALVYGLAILAIGRTVMLQKRVALLAGILQLSLAGLGLYQLVQRIFFQDYLPYGPLIMLTSVLALLANAYCLFLLRSHRSKKAHWQASTIFTSNDILINLGVIVAGGLVWYFQSAWPDLLIGALIFGLVSLGAIRILKLSKS